MKNTKKGFTLVELLIVIAIIAILATVSIIGYTSFIDKAQQSVDQQLVDQINTLLTAEAADGVGCSSIGEVKALLAANGYNDPLVPAFKGYTYGFMVSKNAFVLIKDGKVVYPEKHVQDNTDGVEVYTTSEGLIFNIADGESAGNYINSGSIKNGYIELADGTYENLKYGFNIGDKDESKTDTFNGYPRYYKTNKIGNLTIGGNGAVLNGFSLYSGLSTIYGQPEGIYYVVQTHEIETLKFENVTFTGGFYTGGETSLSITNLVFENVTFDMQNLSPSGANAPVYIYDENADNITFINCKFINCDNFNMAIQINSNNECAKSVTVDGCEFDGVAYNAINISGKGVETLTFTNNTIKNTGNRGIRIAEVTVKATVSGNTLENAADANGEVIKIGIAAGADVVVENNTHNGNSVNWDASTGIGK